MPIYSDINNKEIIRILNNIAVLLSIKGENPFKTRAYSNAAAIISEQGIDIPKAVADGTLGSIKGFGEALLKKITEFVETGSMTYYQKLIEEIPESLLDLTKITTIGPQKAKSLYEKEGISTLDQLQEACESGRIAKMKGFSDKSVEMILNSIYHKKAAKGKYLLDSAIMESNTIFKILAESEFVKKIEITGSNRRFVETPRVIEFIVLPFDHEKLLDFLKEKYELTRKQNIIEFKTNGEIPVRLYIASDGEFFFELHQTTGNEEYISAFEEHLEKMGIDNKVFEVNDEQEIFTRAGLQFIPPELRESRAVIDNAAKGNIPELIRFEDMRGMLHVHSNWSDGKSSIEEMALRASELGYEYIAICDHSRSAAYANGLSIDRVKQQHDEIDSLNEQGLGIKILKGIESDILPDGSLDYPDSVLETFDLVVASVHSSFNMKLDEMTKRTIYALMSPYTTILGHPTGRLLLARPAYEIDIHAIIDAAVEYNKVIEINCNPYRLDLSWQNVIYAKQKGLKIAINPDSHHKNTMTDVEIGVKVARKGGLTAADVINTLPEQQFIRFLQTK